MEWPTALHEFGDTHDTPISSLSRAAVFGLDARDQLTQSTPRE